MDNAFNTYGFGGPKSLVVATSSAFGTRNFVFAYAWMISGIVYLAIAVVYAFMGNTQDLLKRRDEETMTAWLMSRLSWRKTVPVVIK